MGNLLQEGGVRDRIHASVASFTKRERRIADYICMHYKKLAYASASDIARALHISPSTVVRFAQKLGFAGYVQLQGALQKELVGLHKITGLSTGEEATMGPSALEHYVNLEMRNVSLLIEQHEALERSAMILQSAERVWVGGDRSSGFLASYGAHFLRMVRKDVFRLGHDMPDQLLDVRHGDALFIASMSRYSRTSTKVARELHGHLPIVLLTDEHLSPLIPYATAVLTFATDSYATLRSLTAGMSLTQALVVEVAARDPDSPHRLDSAERLWESFDVFEFKEV